MFYSHELLTSRQYGVATIWLVATLGSKSNLKKVTRKAILDVDVPKACVKITDPDAPLALRLQGSLLYGLSRVYSQQCTYVLADTQSFRDKMRGIQQIMKELELDPDIGRMRPEQLNLPEDPAFFPDLDMNLDLAAFGFESDTRTARSSSVLSTRSPASSQTSHGADAADGEEPGVELPSYNTPGGYGGFVFPLGAATSFDVDTASRAAVEDVFQESAIIEEPGFEIDADGSIVIPSERERESAIPSMAGEGRAVSESGFSARVRAEHEGGAGEDTQVFGFDMDDGMVIGQDEEPRLPSAEPLPPAEPEGRQPLQYQPGSSLHPSHEPSTTTTAEAPQRRARQPKELQVDQRAELSNRQLGEWSANYTANMAALSHTKEQNKSRAQAKKNAAYWVLSQGIGGVEANFGDDRFPHPLSVYSGQNLLDALRGRETSPVGSKRARSASLGFDEEEEERRVRPRGDDGEHVARGNEGDIMGFDDDAMLPPGGDYNIESEVGRQAPSSLREQSSAMPWNISSRAGSAQRLGSAGPGASSSVGGTGAILVGPPSMLGRRGSRLTSASPLAIKAPRLPSLDIHDDPTGAGDEGIMPGEDDFAPGGSQDLDDFELYGPSAAVDTQTAAQSQWLTSTLENEACNFLNFVQTQIGERGERMQDEAGETVKFITLDDLLPPAENTKVVGAQAMLHVLALTTKGLIQVEQEEAFGDIRMRVVPSSVEIVEDDGDDGEP